MAKPKKYQLGRLEVTDRLQLERDEIIVELIDRMQKYVVQAEQLARDESLELETRLTAVKHISGRLSGLVEFLQVDMRVDARKAERHKGRKKLARGQRQRQRFFERR